jgi:hypothetical protein
MGATPGEGGTLAIPPRMVPVIVPTILGGTGASSGWVDGSGGGVISGEGAAAGAGMELGSAAGAGLGAGGGVWFCAMYTFWGLPLGLAGRAEAAT